jgi:hypothetical protein
VQINSVARQLLAPLGAGSSTGGSDHSQVSAGVAELSHDDDSTVQSSTSFHQILSEYDMESITPKQFGELITRLHDAGAIDDGELRQLAKIRTDLEQSGVAADNPIDLIGFLEQKERAAQSRFDLLRQDSSSDPTTIDDAETALEESSSRLQWVRKFSLVHDSGASGIDAGA